MTVSGSTTAPGRITRRSTVAAVLRAMRRISSGTRVPGPRTCRSISPRFTVSRQTVAASTLGAAGSSR